MTLAELLAQKSPPTAAPGPQQPEANVGPILKTPLTLVPKKTPGQLLALLGSTSGTERAAIEANLRNMGYLPIEIRNSKGRSNIEWLATSKNPPDYFRDAGCEGGCPEMIPVRSGTFLLGAGEGENSQPNEYGAGSRQVSITIARSFAASRYEITVGQYKAFVDAQDYSPTENPGCATWQTPTGGYRKGFSWNAPGLTQTPSHPVVCVTHTDAEQYASWLSKLTRQSYRLLSEMEWEFIARAGTATPFAFGHSISPSQANFGTNRSVPVNDTNFIANGWGFSHLHGNVLEWVKDCMHGSYSAIPVEIVNTGAAWTTNCDDARRMMRGGSWLDGSDRLRSAFRTHNVPTYRSVTVGFRIARDL